jgi:hypothetical protein
MKTQDLRQDRDIVTKNSIVYFIHDEEGGKVKVGFTADLAERQRQARTFNANRLVLLGTVQGDRKDESRIQQTFQSWHIQGEWFRADDAFLDAVRIMVASRGTARTVQDELLRRNNCRFGLAGVMVAMNGTAHQPFRILSSSWGANSQLLLKLEPADVPGDDDFVLTRVPASRCALLSDWPVTCRCWLPE